MRLAHHPLLLTIICIREALKKLLNKGGGVGIPKLYLKLWWLLFLAMKFTFLFLILAKIHIFIHKFGQNAYYTG